MELLSFWRRFSHWLHWKLPKWHFQCSQWRKCHKNDDVSVLWILDQCIKLQCPKNNIFFASYFLLLSFSEWNVRSLGKLMVLSIGPCSPYVNTPNQFPWNQFSLICDGILPWYLGWYHMLWLWYNIYHDAQPVIRLQYDNFAWHQRWWTGQSQPGK